DVDPVQPPVIEAPPAHDDIARNVVRALVSGSGMYRHREVAHDAVGDAFGAEEAGRRYERGVDLLAGARPAKPRRPLLERGRKVAPQLRRPAAEIGWIGAKRMRARRDLGGQRFVGAAEIPALRR